MQPYFIDLPVDKFQQCCYPDCNKGAVQEVIANNLHLGVCEQEGHLEYVQNIRTQLLAGTEITKLIVHIQNVFIHPEAHTQKCKYLQWERYLVNQEDEIPIPQPKAHAQRLKTHKLPKPYEQPEVMIIENWKWVSNYGKWMNTAGKIVKLPQLSTEEFLDSIQAIIQTNFTRVTKRVQWTRELKPDDAHYKYPEEALYVGFEEAGNKLEEFKEEAQVRGLLS